MVKLLFWKMARDMRRGLAAYLVAAVVVAVGFAGYSVLSIAAGNLQQSKEYFFRATSFGDGLAEVREAPLSAVREVERLPGIRAAQGRLVKEVSVYGLGQECELKLFSVEAGGMNLPLLSRGALPRAGERGLVLGEGFSAAHGLLPGDRVELALSGRRVPLTVTGAGLSPENIYLVKNISDLLPLPAAYDAAFLDYGVMAGLLGMEGKVNSVVFTLENGTAFSDVEEAVREVLSPYGLVSAYGAEDELSVSMLEMELTQLWKMTGVIPFLFLSIAAVILGITLHRLMEQQRTQIGTLMAMGLPARLIACHYAGYGAAVGLLGGLAGGIYGSLAAGPLADFYRVYFSLPDVSSPISPRHLLLGTAAATLFCGGVGGLADRGPGRLVPAEALRPTPPKDGRALFLERFPWFTGLFTVPGLLAVRSIARNRRRALLSLCGIACAYMITATLVSMNAMFDLFIFDYLTKTQRQDLTVSFEAPVAAGAALAAVRDPGVERAEGVLELPTSLRGTAGELDCLIQAIPGDSQLCRLYDEGDRAVAVPPQGLVLSVHMAQQLGVGAGDTVEVEITYPRARTTRVEVTGIIAQYLGATAYMSHEGAAQVSGWGGVCTSVLLKAPEESRRRIAARLEDAPLVAAVQSRQTRLDQYDSMMGMMGGVMASMAGMGVLVGFAVIYTSSLISYEELKQEVATMRMLGLTHRQCLETISTGQWFLALAALVPGVPMTMGVSRLITQSMSSDLYSIPSMVDPASLGLAALLLFASVAWSNRSIYRRLRRARQPGRANKKRRGPAALFFGTRAEARGRGGSL